MRFTLTLVFPGLLALVLLAGEAAAVPVTVGFVGRLATSDGLVDGSADVTFRIYDDPVDGTLVWEETHYSISVDQGLVYVELGSVDPAGNGLDETVFVGDDLFLEVEVDAEVMQPRLAISSAPYAIRAGVAESAELLGSLGEADVALAAHDHDGLYAPLTHTHAEYALTSHGHDGDYAPLSHSHSDYALTTHNHDGVYASVSHSHSDYALTTHNHDGVYAPISHSHSGYALTGHNHDGTYAPATHSHPAPTCTTRSSSAVWLDTWYNHINVSCNSGEIAVGGGYSYGNWSTSNQCIPIASYRNSSTSWRVTFGAPTESECSGHTGYAYVVCCAW